MLRVICALIARLAADLDDYGERVDPWEKRYEQYLRVSEDEVWVIQLFHGELHVETADGRPVDPAPDVAEQLLGLFGEGARRSPVSDDAWAERQAQYASGATVDDACPVNGENHLERTILDVAAKLAGPPHGRAINVGGLYGGKDGELPDAADDPTVELLRAYPTMRVLCWDCGDVHRVTRASALAQQFEHATPDLLTQDLAAELNGRLEGWEAVDLLRLDFLPAAQSCRVLRALLPRVRPRLVAMLVLSQVPPPFQFESLQRDPAAAPPSLYSCSLAAAQAVLRPHGLELVRLTGPYAVFAAEAEWPSPLPLNELDCYRKASIWGYTELPGPFVRDWLFAPLVDAELRLFGNLTAIFAGTAGVQAGPFALGIARPGLLRWEAINA